MKKRFLALILSAALLLTACNTAADSGNASLPDSSVSSVTSEESSSDITADSSDVSSDASSSPSEVSSDNSSSVSSDENSSSNNGGETSFEETSKPSQTTSSSSTTAFSTPSQVTAAATTTTSKPAASATTTAPSSTTTSKKPAATTTSKTTTTKKPQPTPSQSSNFTYDSSASEVLDSFGVDAAGRIKYYDKIVNDTTLPIIHVTTEGKQMILSNEEYTNCFVDVFNCGKNDFISAQRAGIKVRGNSTAYYGDVSQIKRNQVPYRIKFETKQNMLGLKGGSKFKNWVLLKATWCVVPDYNAFKLAKEIMGGKYYSSDCTLVYLYVNEAFAGLYLLCEQQQINKNRVNINEVEKDYTGTDIGYFVELDNYATGEEHWFSIDYCGETVTDIEGTKRKFVPAEFSFKNDIYSQEQVDFIQKYISGVFEIMVKAIKYKQYYTFDSNYNLVKSKYTNAYDTINAVADVESIVDMYILHEICHSNDCGEGSFYMAVDFSKNSKMKRLTFTAPWDFNWAYENIDKGHYYAAAFNDQSFVDRYGDRSNPWFVLLMTADWFRDLVKTKWKSCYSGISSSVSNTRKMIEANYDSLNIEAARRIEGVWADNGIDLIDRVKTRVKWLNKQWG